MRQLVLSVVAAVLLAVTAPSSAQEILVVELPPDRDTSIRDDPVAASTDGQGAAPFLYVGNRCFGSHRALLRFDTSTIPRGAEILSASLEMVLVEGSPVGIEQELNRLTAAWGEAGSMSADPCDPSPAQPGDATWLHTFFDTDFWSTPGGDFAQPPSAAWSGALGPVVVPSTPATVADVQSWVDDPSTNHGWILQIVIPISPGYTQYWSREAPDPADRPRLVVSFIPPLGFPSPLTIPTQSTWGLILLATLLLLAGLRLTRGAGGDAI